MKIIIIFLFQKVLERTKHCCSLFDLRRAAYQPICAKFFEFRHAAIGTRSVWTDHGLFPFGTQSNL